MATPSTENLPTEERFRALNKAMALVLLNDCYDEAIKIDAPFSRKMELLKLNAKLGDLEPRANSALINAGSGAVINFHFSRPPPGETHNTITIEADPLLPEVVPSYMAPTLVRIPELTEV